MLTRCHLYTVLFQYVYMVSCAMWVKYMLNSKVTQAKPYFSYTFFRSFLYASFRVFPRSTVFMQTNTRGYAGSVNSIILWSVNLSQLVKQLILRLGQWLVINVFNKEPCLAVLICDHFQTFHLGFTSVVDFHVWNPSEIALWKT